MATLFQLGLELKVDKAVNGINRVDSKLGKIQKQAKKTGQLLKAAFAIGGAVIAIRGVTRAFSALASAARDGELSAAKLSAVLKSTQHAAGLTSREINAVVDSLEGLTLFNDDELRTSAAQLLTFQKITGDTFERTLKSIADLSTIMDGDLKASTLLLGKAINDPITGMSALSRVGIALSDVQKKQIRSFTELGDVAAAQGVILAEVESQVQGQAAGANVGLTGAITGLTKAWDDMLEAMARQGPISSAATAFLNLSTAIIKAFTPLSELDHVIIELDKVQEKIAELINANTSPTGVFNVRESDSVNQRLADLQALEAGYKALIEEANTLERAEQKIIDALPTPRTEPIFNLNTVVREVVDSTGEAEEAAIRLSDRWQEIDKLYAGPGTGERWAEPSRIFETAWDQAIRNIQSSLSGMLQALIFDVQSLSDVLNSLVRGLVGISTQVVSANFLKSLGLSGFAHGGLVDGPVGKPRLAVLHGGERVIPRGNTTQDSGTTISLTVNPTIIAADAASFAEMADRNGDALASIIVNKLKSNPEARRVLAGGY